MQSVDIIKLSVTSITKGSDTSHNSNNHLISYYICYWQGYSKKFILNSCTV